MIVTQIDRKFHIDEHGQIVKTSNGEIVSGKYEPLILFRARDYLALPMLKHYKNLSMADDATTYHLDGLDAVIADFEAFAKAFPERMKQPGITRGE